MSTLKIIPIFLFLFAFKSSYSQNYRLSIEIEILPELRNYFQDKEIEIDVISDKVNSKILKNLRTTTFDSINKINPYVTISAFIKNRIVEKNFYLFVPDIMLNNDSITKIHILFPLNCAYNLNALNKKCPKCKRSDKVIPIFYGLLIMPYDKKGHRMKQPIHYSGGCDVSDCDPTWYCERDQSKF